jgi:hypothetical protein
MAKSPTEPPGSPAPLAGKCGAQLRLSVEKYGQPRYCIKDPLTGKTRCKLHGGKSLSGVAHPNFEHGLYSDVLKRLPIGGHYNDLRAATHLVQLRDHVALVTARIFELLEQMGAGEGPAVWRRAADAMRACDTAMQGVKAAVADRTPNRGALMADALRTLDAQIAVAVAVAVRGAQQADTWPLINEQVLLHKKLVDSEVKRQKAAHEALSREQALAVFANIADSIRRNVSNVQERQCIVDDMRRLLSGGSDGRS